MHCDCCDKLLTDYECSIKHRVEGYYLNTCTKCLRDLGIPFVGNTSLSRKPTDEDLLEDDFEDLVVVEDSSDINMDDLIFTNIDRFSEYDE